jgi:hypothetical protein
MRPSRPAVRTGTSGPELNLAWHRQHLPGVVAMTSAYYFLLVPAETSGDLALVEYEYVTHTGRPVGRIYANPLQLISPRDPELTAGGATSLQCPKEMALVQTLYLRAGAASYILPRIVPTGTMPLWARGTISSKARHALWRAGGA